MQSCFFLGRFPFLEGLKEAQLFKQLNELSEQTDPLRRLLGLGRSRKKGRGNCQKVSRLPYWEKSSEQIVVCIHFAYAELHDSK